MTQTANTGQQATGEERNRKRCLRFRPEVAFRVVGGEAFLVTPDRAMHRVTAASGVVILEALQARAHTHATLLAEVASRFRGETEQIERDTDGFLADLLARGVVEEFDEG